MRELHRVILLILPIAATDLGGSPKLQEVSTSTIASESVALSPDSYTTARVIGIEETVYHYQTQRCAEDDIPDTPARAFRDASSPYSRIQMISGHSAGNRRLIGISLDTLARDCEPIMVSHYDPHPENKDDQEFIHGLYTLDGRTVLALVHNEYQGKDHAKKFPFLCPDAHPSKCWKTSTTSAVATAETGRTDYGASYSHQISTDGGLTFHPAPPPTHAIAWVGAYDPSRKALGLSAPSNILKNDEDGYYYATIWAWNDDDTSTGQQHGMCVIRTRTIFDPLSWRAWDGDLSNSPPQFSTLPLAGSPCPTLHESNSLLPAGMMPTQITFNTYLKKFMLLGYTHYEVYFFLSDDLIHWGPPHTIIGLIWPKTDGPGFRAYPTLFDPKDPSRNFEQPGQFAYLHYTRFNAGMQSLDRDLVRVLIGFERETGYARRVEPDSKSLAGGKNPNEKS